MEREQNDRLRQLLSVDYVTGLPVRRKLGEVLRPRIADSNSLPFALAVVRLDERFRRRPMSSEMAGVLLYGVGQRLTERAPDRVYQSWRTDEYIVLVDDTVDTDVLAETSAAIREAIQRPFSSSGVNIRLGCHVGFAVFPEHGRTVPELLGNAEIALGIVEQREDSSGIYHADMGYRRRRQFAIEQEITDAIQSGLDQFSLAFQPIVDRTCAIHGAEALMRWDNDALGSVPPAEFIPVAEQYGQIQILGLWAVYQAATIARTWVGDDHLEPPVVSLNVSAVQLRDPDFAERIIDLFATASVPPGRFRLELTESAIVEDPERARETLETLRGFGVQLMIDDFGTGFSSFTYLHTLPIDTIKIAKEFVDTIVESSHSRAIVRSIIHVAKGIGGTALAEGIETLDQFDVLMEEGCDYFQGYLFGRPQVTNDLNTLVVASDAEFRR